MHRIWRVWKAKGTLDFRFVHPIRVDGNTYLTDRSIRNRQQSCHNIPIINKLYTLPELYAGNNAQ